MELSASSPISSSQPSNLMPATVTKTARRQSLRSQAEVGVQAQRRCSLPLSLSLYPCVQSVSYDSQLESFDDA